MRNFLILLVFLLLFTISVINEPIDDVLDAMAGGTNTTYGLKVDSIAGVTVGEDDEDDNEIDDEMDDDL